MCLEYAIKISGNLAKQFGRYEFLKFSGCCRIFWFSGSTVPTSRSYNFGFKQNFELLPKGVLKIYPSILSENKFHVHIYFVDSDKSFGRWVVCWKF